MNPLQTDQTKAIASEVRVNLLEWLKTPEKHFSHQETGKPSEIGVCVGLLAEKAKVAQPTMSRHLELLRRAKFVKVVRVGKWSFYSRDEAGLAKFKAWVSEQL